MTIYEDKIQALEELYSAMITAIANTAFDALTNVHHEFTLTIATDDKRVSWNSSKSPSMTIKREIKEFTKGIQPEKLPELLKQVAVVFHELEQTLAPMKAKKDNQGNIKYIPEIHIVI